MPDNPAYVKLIAGTVQQAKSYARMHDLPKSIIVGSPHGLRGLRGEGLTILLAGTYYDRRDWDAMLDNISVLRALGATVRVLGERAG